MSTFRISALPADELERIRARGSDDYGNALVITVNLEAGGPPLRCCLREAALGERVTLIAYRPSTVGSPYDEVGPVFVHADPCPGWSGNGYPDDYRHRSQLLRAYDHTGRQVDNVIVEPGAAEEGIRALLGRPDVAYLHSRNLLAGCWMFAAHPAAAEATTAQTC